jgi:hypothetical protein
MALAQALRACQHGSPSEADSGGASTWPIGDRTGGAVVRGMPDREATTHRILDEDGVPGETMPGAGTRRVVRSNRTSDTEG